MITCVRLQFSNTDFFKFLLVGALTVLVNLVTFNFLLVNNFSIYSSTLFGNLTSILINFVGLSEIFNSERKILVFIKYVISWVSYYFLTIFIVFLLIALTASPLQARVFALCILTPINFLVQKKLIFNV